MSHPSKTFRPLIRLSIVLAVLVGLGAGIAQTPALAGLLPEETVFALGVRDLAAHEDRLRPFVEEAERLELLDHLFGLAPDEAEQEMQDAVPPALADIGAMDLIGDEAWLAVSISRFNPLPAATLVVRPSEAGAAAVDAMIESAGPSETMQEGDLSFQLFQAQPPEEGMQMEMELPPVAVARFDGLVAVSTQPEVMRAVLRRHAGEGDPSLLDSEVWQQAVAPMGEGQNTYSLLHLSPALPAVLPLVQGAAPEALIDRVVALVETIGPSATATRLTEAGVESASRQVPNADGGDTLLYDLLTQAGAADRQPLAFVPEGALTVNASTFDLSGWWEWLGDVLASASELGVPSLEEATQMAGVDVEQTLLSWSDDQVAVIVTGASAPAEPGLAADALLGEQVVFIEATDEQAAFDGLSTLLQTVGMQASALADPSGQPQATVETTSVAGVDVARMEVSENVVVSVAAVDGYGLISGSNDALQAVLEARAADGEAPASFAELAEGLPESARAYTLSDDRASLEGTVEALVSQLQLGAGLAGAQQLDFERVEAASEAVRAYAEFVAERLEGSRAVTTVEDGAIVGESLTPIDW